MPLSLSDYLDITPSLAAKQFEALKSRKVIGGKRQDDFLPIETLLCQAAMLLVSHRRFGSTTAHKAGAPVPELALLFRRKPTSVLAKMANLDGTRPNGAKWDRVVGATLSSDLSQLGSLYRIVLAGARASGVSSTSLPDFLGLEAGGEILLLGQEELADINLQAVLGSEVEQALADAFRAGDVADEPDTEKLVIARARIGQHGFAKEVLANCGNQCVFCGLSIGRGIAGRMLVASHIKPWRDSQGTERTDVTNGLAACPIHDAAFDAGLLTINGGRRIRISSRLGIQIDSGNAASFFFGQPPMFERIEMPEGSQEPGPTYLKWHKEKIFTD